jgi:hypothetical protein
MTNDELNPNDEARNDTQVVLRFICHSGFDIPLMFIRASSFQGIVSIRG